MKKIISFMVVMALGLSLAACGTSDGTGQESGTEQENISATSEKSEQTEKQITDSLAAENADTGKQTEDTGKKTENRVRYSLPIFHGQKMPCRVGILMQ